MNIRHIFAILLLLLAPLAIAKNTPQLDYNFQAVEFKNNQAKLLFTADLKDNWKLYWRHPGDGGLPLQLDVKSKSHTIERVDILWPAPTRFVSYDIIETYGYKHKVTLPIVVTFAPSKERAVRLEVKGEFGVCDEICVFHNIANNYALFDGHTDKTGLKHFIDALEHTPKQDERLRLNVVDATEDTLMIRAHHPEHAFTNPDLFLELNENVRFPKGSFRLSDKRHTVMFTLPYELLLEGASLSGETLRATLTDQDHAFDAQLTLPTLSVVTDLPVEDATDTAADTENKAEGKATSTNTGKTPLFSLWQIVLFAMLGGLILNVMPCVLPVLALKLMHVLHMDKGDTARIRKGFWVTTLGILVSFAILALAVVLLKAFGSQAGWGFHFQSPLFVGILFFITLFFGLSQLGLFEIILPYNVSTKLNNAAAGESTSSQFLAGVTATLLATPCTAPFLGTAVGFALQQGIWAIFVIFMSVGVGLALPYILVALFPRIARLLPKPGNWMLHVKRIFGIMLLATALWLASILKDHFFGVDNSANMQAGWQNFSQERVTQHVQNGDTVFVDITASWCLTCKFNKKTTLDTDGFENWANAHEIARLRGDYTNGNAEIYAFLQQHNRAGVPFNAIFSPTYPNGYILPEVLSLDEIKQVGGE